VETLKQMAAGLRLLALDPAQDPHGQRRVEIGSWWGIVHPLFRNVLGKGAKLEAHLAQVLCKDFMFEREDGNFYLGPTPQFHIMVPG
jgi:hypothetical protein